MRLLLLGGGSGSVAEANTVQRVQQRYELLPPALAHQANLDPISAPEIFAVVAQQIAGLPHEVSDPHRV